MPDKELDEGKRRWLIAATGSSLCGSLIVTTSPDGVVESRSGRKVEITNSTARHTVAVWQNVSQSLRMEV